MSVHIQAENAPPQISRLRKAELARPTGLEPVAPGLEDGCAIHLSYETPNHSDIEPASAVSPGIKALSLSAKPLFNRLVADRGVSEFDVLRYSAHAHHGLRVYVMVRASSKTKAIIYCRTTA
jgi:hypothetical protein